MTTPERISVAMEFKTQMYPSTLSNVSEAVLVLMSATIFWKRTVLFNTFSLFNLINFYMLLNSPVTVGNASKENTVKLQCYLNTYEGYRACLNRNIHIEWSWEDNTPIKGNRFKFVNHSECFSELSIHLKRTDHHKKWKCRLFQSNTLEAAISGTTTVQGTIAI